MNPGPQACLVPALASQPSDYLTPAVEYIGETASAAFRDTFWRHGRFKADDLVGMFPYVACYIATYGADAKEAEINSCQNIYELDGSC